jgi:hypothetical protein
MSEAARTAVRLVERVALDEDDGGHGGDHELGDAVTPHDVDGILAEVDEQHFELPR